MAEAARVYGKQVNATTETINYASEIKLRSERKLGQLLAKAELNKGTMGKGRPSLGATKTEAPKDKTPTLKEVGVSFKTSSESQKLAEVTDERFEEAIAVAREAGEMAPTQVKTDLIRELTRKERVDKIVFISKGNKELKTDKTYPVILCDPPWRYEHTKTDNRKIENQYPTMELAEICELSFENISTPDCVLFMWTTSPKLQESFEVLKWWGMTYRTCAVWVKDKIGMGYYFRQQHELLLVATKGSIPVPEPSDRVSSVFKSDRTEHSKKPEVVYEAIEKMYPEYRNKLEIFSRSERPGWDSWGNES